MGPVSRRIGPCEGAQHAVGVPTGFKEILNSTGFCGIMGLVATWLVDCE